MKARIKVIEADHQGMYYLQGVCASQTIFFLVCILTKLILVVYYFCFLYFLRYGFV